MKSGAISWETLLSAFADRPLAAPNTRRRDVDGWDSLMYVAFIVAIEMELKIKFRVADVESFETVGNIVAEARSLLV